MGLLEDSDDRQGEAGEHIAAVKSIRGRQHPADPIRCPDRDRLANRVNDQNEPHTSIKPHENLVGHLAPSIRWRDYFHNEVGREFKVAVLIGGQAMRLNERKIWREEDIGVSREDKPGFRCIPLTEIVIVDPTPEVLRDAASCPTMPPSCW